MSITWMALYPGWYAQEREAISRRYPQFHVDTGCLDTGILRYYGELLIRPPGGTKRHAVQLVYPDATPFEPPIVTPIQSLPVFDSDGVAKTRPHPLYLERRHQMPRGALCLFQRETRGNVGGECITGLDALRRAEGWFLGYYTGHWPPDTRDSELESHFPYAGDVLVSEAFYAPELSGAGEFFMVRDLRRILDAVWQDACPLIVTTITNRKNEVVSVIDARNDLERIYPWIDKDAWNPESIAVAFDSKKEELLAPVEKGWWWSLPEEPFPFVNGKGLLKALAAIATDENPWKLVCSALGTDLSVGSELFFGLRYPKRGGGVEWLVLWMSPSSKPTPSGGVLIRNDDAKRRTFEETQVACYHVHGARPSDFRLRNTGVVAPRIEGKTVALIGLGALGSRVAELLGQAGVGAIQLCDLDHLKIGNIARHIGGVRDFGACKTRVVAARLFDVNPYVEIPPVIEGSAVASLDRLAKYLRTADITVCTVADEQVESAINQIAVIEGKAVLYARALRRGAMGRVFLVRPGRDPCKACLGEYARVRTRGESATKDWIEVTESDDDAVIHECGRPVIPASAIDLSFIATLAARVALDVLEEVDGETNHWVWSRASALDVDPRLDHPFATVACCLPPWAACGICSEPDVSSLLIQDDVRSFIVNQVESSLSTETGGILIGFVGDGGQAVVLRATGPGPKAEKSATRFDRDVTFVQRELNMAARELGERGRYIGEWHSHLVPDPLPSPLDISSMSGIATSPHYANPSPVLLIAGLDKSTGKVQQYNAWSFASGRRFESLEVLIGESGEGCA